MHLDYFDRQAVLGQSPVHRASTLSKLLLVAAVVAGMLLARSPAFYGGAAGILLALALTARLRLGPLLHMLLYPALFAAIFAISGLVLTSQRWLVVARSLTTAGAVLLLFATTSYFEVFAALRWLLPGILGDVLLLTYRSFFILARELQRTLQAVRLKGGVGPMALARNVRTGGAVIGLTTLHALELSERMHHALMLRGYRGAIPTARIWWRTTPCDWLTGAAAAAILLLALWVR